jgi:biopolymer transport protein ExbD
MGGGGGGEGDGDFGFQIAPMVDVVFVLLLFFMACAGTNQTEGLLKIALPSQSAGTDTPIVPIVVDIDAAGHVFINGVQRGGGGADNELTQLTDDLTREMEKGRAAGKTDPVIIRPALDTPHERIINVLNSCRKARVENLSFS